jgi:hypothetical protein
MRCRVLATGGIAGGFENNSRCTGTHEGGGAGGRGGLGGLGGGLGCGVGEGGCGGEGGGKGGWGGRGGLAASYSLGGGAMNLQQGKARGTVEGSGSGGGRLALYCSDDDALIRESTMQKRAQGVRHTCAWTPPLQAQTQARPAAQLPTPPLAGLGGVYGCHGGEGHKEGAGGACGRGGEGG